jgi:hypothetical protein
MQLLGLTLSAFLGGVLGQTSIPYTSTAASALPSDAATARTESPTSNVRGKAFDRILTVYLETTAFGNATADRKLLNHQYQDVDADEAQRTAQP